MREVGIAPIDGGRFTCPSQLTQDGRLVMVLLTERRNILRLVARENDRPQALEFVDNRSLGSGTGFGHFAEALRDLGEEFDFICNDGVLHDDSVRFYPWVGSHIL